MNKCRNRKSLLVTVVLCLMFFPLEAQVFFNDFEGDNDNIIWRNVALKSDSTAYSGIFVCECDEKNEYAFGLETFIDKIYSRHNLLLSVDMMLKAENQIDAVFVVSVKRGNETLAWQSFNLKDGYEDSLKWYNSKYEIVLPSDCLEETTLKCYIWNKSHEKFFIDDVTIDLKTKDIPTFVPAVAMMYPLNMDAHSTENHNFNILFSKNEKNLVFADGKYRVLTKPVSMFYSAVIDDDTIDIQDDKWRFIDNKVKDGNDVFRFRNKNNIAETTIILTVNETVINFKLETKPRFSGNLLRASLVMPFNKNDFTIYRQNMYVDTTDYQDVYYLGEEGFSINQDGMNYGLYHPENLSSIQLNAKEAVVFFNIDYYQDHQLIHYPLAEDSVDYHIDKSALQVNRRTYLDAEFDFFATKSLVLPRIMRVPFGYESAIIWTEHADWTDVRTHRATYFGSEEITDADSAVGGYVFYGVPVTKSVFYDNPDSVRNDEKNPEFAGLHATIKTDTVFYDFLKQLKNKGFDICLHTPEQYSTNHENLAEALIFMKENFGSPSWIDHGYNNSMINNRENMICDGLDEKSTFYSADLWKENGVKYLWNATLEETGSYDNWQYDCHLQRPYHGFGDAFPLPRMMTLPSEPDFLLWTTSYTTEHSEKWAWNYFFAQEKLEKIVESRSIFITHCYSPWVTEERGFWEMKNGKVLAKDGFNNVLKRIAELRDKHLMLPTTVAKQMKYLEQLQNVDYKVNNDGSVILTNNNDEVIDGFSMILESGMDVERQDCERRVAGEEMIIWFDFGGGEKVLIRRKVE